MEEALLPRDSCCSGRSVSSLICLPGLLLSVLCNNLQGKGLLVTSGHYPWYRRLQGDAEMKRWRRFPSHHPRTTPQSTQGSHLLGSLNTRGRQVVPESCGPEPTLWPEDYTRSPIEPEGMEGGEQGVLGEAQSLPFILQPLSP